MIVAVAIGRAFPTTGFFVEKSCGRRFSSTSFESMKSMVKFKNDDTEPNSCPKLKVLEPENLRKYYEETRRIILKQGNRNRTGGDPVTTTLESTKSSISSLSLEEKSIHFRDNTTLPTSKAFTLQHFEPRHRRSMLRCVLNHFDTDDNVHAKSLSIMTKTEFQQRLRIVDRKRRWIMTRQLLFGEDSLGSNSEKKQQRHWWESGIISEHNAPGLTQVIREYKNSWAHNASLLQVQKIVDEEKIDPKKFLSRLAKGRTYKGNFRGLLDDYIVACNESEKEELISLYDRITGGGESTSLSWEETNRREVELLHSFIDEIQEEGEDSNHRPTPITEPPMLARSSDQISLLRSICDLDIFTSAPPSKSRISSNGGTSVDDGGRSLGKKGEQDLETFLQQKLIEGGNPSSEHSANFKVLSPVWIRPKYKNRRNMKQKCRYVLEVPRLQDSENSSNKSDSDKGETKTNTFMSQGTTNEFDAMVVRIIQSDIDDERDGDMLPIMVIDEVWEAKATLDPSALMDALGKKVRSLEKILCDENANVVNLSDGDFGSTDDSVNHGANFVVLPPPGSKQEASGNSTDVGPIAGNLSLPKVYRVGIEPRKDCGSYQSLPQFGVFATRMIGPGAAARRIETIVYEKMLESDVITVKGVAQRGHGGVCDDKMDSHCNRLVRDRSVEIIERILRLIDTLKPIVVVEI